ncbi:MAG: hypothetical protein GFGODING_00127 [Flavobacteriales bacterium]|nr:hypothetical protein [Flavobacteriales bacterium]NUQ14092.1 hypothetical protein [Flavobacteriales bacterium]
MHRLLSLSLVAVIALSSAYGQTPSPATIFGTNGCADINILPGQTSFLKSHALQPDGKLLLAGWGGDGFPYVACMARIDTACGALDPTFGQNGVLVHHFEQRTICSSMALQADGKIVGAGLIAASNAGSGQFPGVWRYNADGSVDSTFNGTGYNNAGFSAGSAAGKVQNVFIDADGRILAAIIGYSQIGVFRYTATGVLDTSYSADGRAEMPVGYTPFHEDLGAVMDPDGSVTIAALVGTSAFDPTFMALARFLPDGDPDPAFGTNGLALHPTISTSTLGSPDGSKDWSMVRRPGSGFLVGYGAHNGDTRPSIAAFNEDGSIDPTYGTNGIVQVTGSNPVGSGLWMDDDGSVLLFYRLSNITNGPGAILRLTPDGQPEAGFGTNGVLQSPFANRSFANGFRLGGGDLVAYGANNNNGNGSVVRFSLDVEANALPVISYDFPDLVVSGGGSVQWFLDGTPISGATASTHTPTQNGTYTVEMNSFGCVNTSPPFQFLSMGIGEPGTGSIAIVNTLVDEHMVIENNGGPVRFIVMDTSGRELQRGMLGTGRTRIPMASCGTGLHLVRVGDSVHRFVVER